MRGGKDMSKKWRKVIISVVLIFSVSILMGSCGNKYGTNYKKFDGAVDTDYSQSIAKKLGSFGDDPVFGMRGAGSPAECSAAAYLAKKMKAAGLKNVTVDKATVDGWTFKGANVTYKGADGKDKKIDLGGYQTTIQAKNEKVDLVYLGKGTEDDYKNVDVKGKLVLIDIDQNNDWWINYPAYQAKVKGAKAVIAVSAYEKNKKDRVGSQDICGPADAPALAISENGSKALQKAIKTGGKGSISVTFNADSKVTKNTTTHNVYGEIPGKTDEVIYLLAHYDGYYHSNYDDAFGVATSLGIAKALVDSGYKPEKTIRVVMHGAEEFGRSGNEYDWSTGAYEDIVTNHPDWAKKAFVALNMDGGYTLKNDKDKNFYVQCPYELSSFVKSKTKELTEEKGYKLKVSSPTTTYTEDFMWQRMGIPAVVAGDSTLYDKECYHSNYDSFKKEPVDTDKFKATQEIYGKLLINFESMKVKPMNFGARFAAFKKTLDEDSGLEPVAAKAVEAAKAVDKKSRSVAKNGSDAEVAKMNNDLYQLYKDTQNGIMGIDYDLNVISPHEMYSSNVENLDKAIKALKAGKIKEAYDNDLSSVDWAWYDMYFDTATCNYFKNQLYNNRGNTWGKGLVKYPHADTNSVVRSLKAKYDTKNADVSSEITQLKQIKKTEEGYLNKTYKAEKKSLQELITTMNTYAE